MAIDPYALAETALEREAVLASEQGTLGQGVRTLLSRATPAARAVGSAARTLASAPVSVPATLIGGTGIAAAQEAERLGLEAGGGYASLDPESMARQTAYTQSQNLGAMKPAGSVSTINVAPEKGMQGWARRESVAPDLLASHVPGQPATAVAAPAPQETPPAGIDWGQRVSIPVSAPETRYTTIQPVIQEQRQEPAFEKLPTWEDEFARFLKMGGTGGSWLSANIRNAFATNAAASNLASLRQQQQAELGERERQREAGFKGRELTVRELFGDIEQQKAPYEIEKLRGEAESANALAEQRREELAALRSGDMRRLAALRGQAEKAPEPFQFKTVKVPATSEAGIPIEKEMVMVFDPNSGVPVARLDPTNQRDLEAIDAYRKALGAK